MLSISKEHGSEYRELTELNQKFIRTGYFVVKDAGILFLNIKIIPIVAQESQTD